MKGVKKAKEHLKTNDLSKENEVPYSQTVLQSLDRKSKNRKRAREISKEMQSKKKAHRPDVPTALLCRALTLVWKSWRYIDNQHGCRNKIGQM